MNCPNCGGDNLTDYPVCAGCAATCHFTHRRDCIHCAASQEVDGDVLAEYLRHVESISDMDARTLAAIRGTVAAFARNNKIKIYQEAA